MSFVNSEGYADPTAGAAIAVVMREEELQRKARSPRHSSGRPLVYICSPFAGDVKRNTAKARRYCRFAVARGCIPIAPHLLFPQFMDDHDPAERAMALAFGKKLLDRCAEVWIFGVRLTGGMKAEYARALYRGIRVRYFTSGCREITRKAAELLYDAAEGDAGA